MNEDGLDVLEANHRMMNMLAILLALFHRNFSKFSDQCVRGAVTKFENQIMAAIELLRTISSTSTAEDAAVDVYLERLGRTLSNAVLGPTNTSFELFVDQGRLPRDVCERLGLIIVELVMNANGVVRIDMIRSGRNWRDDDRRRSWPYAALSHPRFFRRDHSLCMRGRGGASHHLLYPTSIHGYAFPCSGVSSRGRGRFGVHCGHRDWQLITKARPRALSRSARMRQVSGF